MELQLAAQSGAATSQPPQILLAPLHSAGICAHTRGMEKGGEGERRRGNYDQRAKGSLVTRIWDKEPMGRAPRAQAWGHGGRVTRQEACVCSWFRSLKAQGREVISQPRRYRGGSLWKSPSQILPASLPSTHHTPMVPPRPGVGGGGRERGPVSWHQFRCGQVCEAWPPHPGKVPRPPGLGTFPPTADFPRFLLPHWVPQGGRGHGAPEARGLGTGAGAPLSAVMEQPGLSTPGRSPSRPSCPILHFQSP